MSPANNTNNKYLFLVMLIFIYYILYTITDVFSSNGWPSLNPSLNPSPITRAVTPSPSLQHDGSRRDRVAPADTPLTGMTSQAYVSLAPSTVTGYPVE